MSQATKVKITIVKKDDLYDLKQDISREKSSEGINYAFIEILNKLIEINTLSKLLCDGKEKTAVTYKINSFTKAKDAIESYDKPIMTGAQAKADIPGIGDGIARRIDEFILTGTLGEVESYLKDGKNSTVLILMALTTVTGIGEVKAYNLIKDFDIKSVDDLIEKYKSNVIKIAKNQLTHHIALGLNYYYDLKLRMPWSEADQIATKIKESVFLHDKDMIVTVCGSYRRKQLTCGDIDVLITKKPGGCGVKTRNDLSDIVKSLNATGLLKGHLTTSGDTKYMGIIGLEGCPGRRIDIRYVEYESMGAAILYFTGSGNFNKVMRFKANQRGYTLNEYGLYKYKDGIKGDKMETVNEEDVFKILKFKYLQPEERL